MTRYTLEWADGRVTDIVADDDASAETAAMARFGADAVAAEQWDDAGVNDDGEPCERLLIWADEEAAENDPGSNAVAQLCVVRCVDRSNMVAEYHRRRVVEKTQRMPAAIRGVMGDYR